MSDLAARLMLRGREQRSAVPTAIFGTAGTVRHALTPGTLPVRIGLWPILSTEQPETAMGVLLMLGYLLERYRNIRVYPLLARTEGDPAAYSWDIAQSQFDVDDWQLETLDDNVGIWGTLKNGVLTLNIESDLASAPGTNTDDVITHTYPAPDLPQLVRSLPDIAAEIAGMLDFTELRLLAPGYAADQWNADDLRQALEQLFRWELSLYLSLWGHTWTPQDQTTQAETLINASRNLGDLGAWIASQGIARALIFADSADEPLLSTVDTLITRFPDSSIPAALISTALFESQQVQEAFNLLEEEIEAERGDRDIYLTAGMLYRAGGRIAEAVDVFQVAIEEELADPVIYRQYAELLVAMEYSGLDIEAYVMIDPDAIPDNLLIWEAVEAYEAALKLAPDGVDLRAAQLIQLAELEGADDRLWAGFRQLVEQDRTGESSQAVIDALQSREDLQPAIDILDSVLTKNPDRVDLHLHLASLYAYSDESEAAQRHLNIARQLTDDPVVLADIERLNLIAEAPEFEMRLGEITDVVNAGGQVQVEDVEFLEAIIEKVPTFAEAYLLLARAYNAWSEASTAIETLLDGHKQLPDDPDIIALLCETLWKSGEEDLALSYLSKGLNKNPNHVPLLALAGQYLFESGQEEAARAYLMRAEAFAPRDPVLIRVRQYIGRTLNQ